MEYKETYRRVVVPVETPGGSMVGNKWQETLRRGFITQKLGTIAVAPMRRARVGYASAA